MDIVLYILGIIILLAIITIFVIAFKIHNSIFNHRFEVDSRIKYYTQEEFNLKSEDIEFYCDKDLLRGKLYYYDNYKDDSIFIYSHGMYSSTRAYMQDIEFISRLGYKVLGFDYTGTDLSEGKSLKGFGQSIKSLDYAIRFIKSKYKDKNIYVVGHSWGGFAATNVVKYHPDIKGICAISPFIKISNQLKCMLPKKFYILIPFLVLIDFFRCGSYTFSNSLKSLKKYKNKTIIVHSKDDMMAKFEYSTQILEENLPNNKFIIVEGKAHNPNYTIDAVRLLAEFQIKSSNLKDEELTNYMNQTDFHKLGELDEDLMKNVIDYLK